jgi:hypothetical protein
MLLYIGGGIVETLVADEAAILKERREDFFAGRIHESAET